MNNNLIKKQPKTKALVKSDERKVGKLSKKAQTFLDIMKESFGFEPAKEFIELYSNEQTLYQELFLRYTDKLKRRRMHKTDVAMFWRLHAELKDTLKTFIKYSYPTLRTMDVKGDLGQRPVFNINLGVPPAPEIKDVTPTINVTGGK